jgi:hypothetical protein
MSSPAHVYISRALHRRYRVAAALYGVTIGELAERALGDWLSHNTSLSADDAELADLIGPKKPKVEPPQHTPKVLAGAKRAIAKAEKRIAKAAKAPKKKTTAKPPDPEAAAKNLLETGAASNPFDQGE